ncbi:hypothetical protein SRHO_G00284090 [Serrasalmus rhombeus]
MGEALIGKRATESVDRRVRTKKPDEKPAPSRSGDRCVACVHLLKTVTSADPDVTSCARKRSSSSGRSELEL